MRLQSAMEFLITYGWAILILIIVIATLYKLGVFSLGSTTPNLCALPADVGCVSAVLVPNGLLTVNIQQATQYTINVIGVGCNSQSTNTMTSRQSQIISIGGNATFAVPCYTNSGAVFNSVVGQIYKGYLIVNYTDLTTGFQHTVVGTLIQTVS